MDKSHQCRICHKGFARAYTAKRHEQTIHAQDEGACGTGLDEVESLGVTLVEDVAMLPEKNLETTPNVTFNLPESVLTWEMENKRANDILTYVFGKEIQQQFNTIVQERCRGCQKNHVNQLKHTCLWLEDDDCEVDGLLKRALAKTDISYLKAVCCETANILNLKLPLSFIYHRINAHKELWEQLRQFGVVVTAMRNMNFGQITDLHSLMDAEHSARKKIDKLKGRVSPDLPKVNT